MESFLDQAASQTLDWRAVDVVGIVVVVSSLTPLIVEEKFREELLAKELVAQSGHQEDWC